MKVLWLDINSSYSHSSVALPAIHAQMLGNTECEWVVVRGTINDDPGMLAAQVAEHQPDIIAATFWLFTHRMQLEVLSRIVQLLDKVQIVCGGPEFLGDNEGFLRSNPYIDAIIRGEGEKALPEWLSSIDDPTSWNDISLKNIDNLAQYFTGSTLTIALMLIGFHIVKSFALVISPVILYTLSGILFDNFWVAIAVNFVGTVLSLFLPYYLGKFMGMEAVESLKKRFKAIEKFDSFTGDNIFGVVFVGKVACLLPSDLNSLVLGAMNLPFGQYFFASNVGLFIISILWTLFGATGDFTNIYSYIYLLPIVFITLGGVLYLSRSASKK